MSTEYLNGVKYIELTQGKYAIVDSELEPLVGQFSWQFNRYATRSVRLGRTIKTVYMHKFIWGLINESVPSSKQIDHINGNKLDNRMCNLRLVTVRQNSYNRVERRNGITSSCMVGIYWQKNRCKWVSRIQIEGFQYYLGTYVLEEDASKAYWDALYEYEVNGVLPYERRDL